MGLSLQKTTLRHVAQIAGVSLKTASRVLNNEPHVKPGKEAAVRAAIKRLSYQPNELARGLRVNRSGVIGVVVPFLSHSFMADCVQAIHHAAQNAGSTIMLTVSNGDADAEVAMIRILLRRQVEGLIIFPTTGNLQSKSATDLTGIPVVVVDQPTLTAKTDSILVANRKASREVVDHLIGHGHSAIAVVGANRRLYTISERIAGYKEAMRAAKLKTLELVPDSEEKLSVAAIGKLFDSPSEAPRAVFALNSAASIKTLHALKQHRLRVPEDVALFGFDDFDTAESFQPSISVVSQPTAKMGSRAVDLLLKRIRQPQLAGERLVLVPHIILRSSCGCNQSL
jgi:LacI family transcriptional regulator